MPVLSKSFCSSPFSTKHLLQNERGVQQIEEHREWLDVPIKRPVRQEQLPLQVPCLELVRLSLVVVRRPSPRKQTLVPLAPVILWRSRFEQT